MHDLWNAGTWFAFRSIVHGLGFFPHYRPSDDLADRMRVQCPENNRHSAARLQSYKGFLYKIHWRHWPPKDFLWRCSEIDIDGIAISEHAFLSDQSYLGERELRWRRAEQNRQLHGLVQRQARGPEGTRRYGGARLQGMEQMEIN